MIRVEVGGELEVELTAVQHVQASACRVEDRVYVSLRSLDASGSVTIVISAETAAILVAELRTALNDGEEEAAA